MPPKTTTHAPALPCVGWIKIGDEPPFTLLTQWCYTENLKVKAGSKNVVTACNVICSLPIGLATRVPTCPECIALGEMVADELGDDDGE